MRKVTRIMAVMFFLGFFCFLPGFIQASEVGFVNSNIWISDPAPIAGDVVQIYAVVVNGGEERLEGEVRFLDNLTGEQVGSTIGLGLDGGGTSNVFSVSWTAVAGNHQFKAEITNSNIEDGLLSETTEIIYVAVDSDDDGLTDDEEEEEGTDPNDPDTDDDGIDDGGEVEGGTDPNDPDTDDDGDPDGTDPDPSNHDVYTPPDTDRDGTPDSIDSDDDNDGLYDWEEGPGGKGTDPLKYDTDDDGYSDKEDAYPLDSSSWEVAAAVVGEQIITDEESSGEQEDQRSTILGERLAFDNGVEAEIKQPSLLDGFLVLSFWAQKIIYALGLSLLLAVIIALLYRLYRKAKDAGERTKKDEL